MFRKRVNAVRLNANRRSWDRLAASDPMWAVLSDPAKRGGRWGRHEFLASGEHEIAGALDLLRRLDADPDRGLAVDFGCGVGRLSRALSAEFEHVVGIDVSAEMLRHARAFNADRPNATFKHNDATDLAILGTRTVHFLYSRLVLQHIPPTIGLLYVAEFARVLSPRGVAMFSAPAADPRRALRRARPALRAIRELLPGAQMSVYAYPRSSVESAIAKGGGRLLTALDDQGITGWPGFLYVVRPS